MEVKEGYKQTEAGFIPKDWEIKTLGALATYTNGRAHEQSIADSGKFIVVNSKFISSEGTIFKNSSDCFCPAVSGDVLMVMSDIPNGKAIAKCFFVARDNIYTVNQRICVLHPKSIDGKLLFYKLDRNPYYLAFDDGAKQTNLRKSEVLSCLITFPANNFEQQAIALALSDIDALIAGLEKLIAKKRDLKQAAMQQLLTGQTRLPGFSGAWEMTKLGDVLHFQVGFPFSSAFFNEKEQGLRLVKNRDLKADDQVFFYSGSYEKDYVVKNDDLLVGMDGDFLPCRWTKGSALLNQRVGRLLPTNRLYIRFAYYFMLEPLKEIEAMTASTTVKHLSHGDIENIAKPLPLLEEQIAIGAVLYDIDTELDVLENRLIKTRELKQGMMQELLTGRTRLV